MCEILAPAGGKKSALAAINSGADAIYLGLPDFSARKSAENFSAEDFKEISSLARIFGVKVYVAMNTLVKDAELDRFLNLLIDVQNAGADAVILSDIFLGRFVKRSYPQIKLHLSTQAGICNAYGAELAKNYGFDRVILSRETKLSDIAEISKIIETEVFVQGALCTCFSGQCYLSSFAGGNSGNRGRCKQPCRKKYSIDRKGFEEPAYRLSLADLRVGDKIEILREAGVSSFKIEGRMRRPEYVAAAVKYYKNLLNGCAEEEDFSDLKRTFNRGNYTAGLAFGQDKNFISSAVQGHIGEFVGVIKVENGKYICTSGRRFSKGDSFKILREGKEVGGADFSGDSEGGFAVTSKALLRSGDKVFVTTDSAVNKRLLDKERKLTLKVSARFFAGERAEISVDGRKFYGDNPLEHAKNSPLKVEDIKECLKRVDKYPFEIVFGEVDTDGVFLPKSVLNGLRRKAYDGIFGILSENKNAQVVKNHVLPQPKTAENGKIAAIVGDAYGISADITVLKPRDYFDQNEKLSEKFTKKDGFGQKYLYLPPFMTGEEIERISPLIALADGVYCDGVWAVGLCERLKKPLFAGCGMNISNRVDLNECPAEYVALSKELTETEQRQLSTEKTFALSSGSLKVMDLIYCPFEKRCSSCDKRHLYSLTDEEGRRFPLARYKMGECRFEVYNCANLVGKSVTGTLIDCTTLQDARKAVEICKDVQKQRIFYKNYTRGHSVSPVL